MKKIAISDLKLLEILNRVPFFKDFSSNERNSFFAQSLTFMQCRANRTIIKQGDKETNFYIILSGHASVYLNNAKQEVAYLSPGYFIGEGAFVNNVPRSATVIAQSDVLLICLDQPTLHRLPASIREKIKDQIIEGLAQRLSDMNHRFLHEH